MRVQPHSLALRFRIHAGPAGQGLNYTSPCLYVQYFTLLISKMYLIRVLSFIGDVRFNVRGEHVPDCLGRGWGRGLGGF